GTSHSITITDTKYDSKFILGVLNSKLMEWVIYDICPVKMGDARKYGLSYIKKLPIPRVSPEEQDQIKILVQEIVEQKKQRQITTNLEDKIDRLVYELYGLTEEEI